MSSFPMQRHPVTPAAAVGDVSVTVGATGTGLLSLCYRVCGEIAALRIPAASAPARTDGLWRHTCFEAFLRRVGQPDYQEWNFAPSGAWAAYRFEAYRCGMAPLADAGPPRLVTRTGEDTLEFEVTLTVCPLGVDATRGLEMALSAVIEDRDGQLSYWALRHGAGQPDFHHPRSFALALRPDASGGISITRI